MLERIDVTTSRASKMSVTRTEKEFLESIRSYWLRKGTLTPGQTSWFERLEEKYSEEQHAQTEKWLSAFSPYHRQTALQVARYYEANPPYFETYVHKILSNPESFTLTEREWNKFCENKYAKKIRKSYEESLRFHVGDCVQIRKTNKVSTANYNNEGYIRGDKSEKVGFVLKTDALPVTRAAKGSRVYQVLLVGDVSPIYAHESDLKRGKKR